MAEILALDLSMQTGWAFGFDGRVNGYGIKRFVRRKNGPSLWMMFDEFARDMLMLYRPTEVVYEQPIAFRSGATTRLLGGLAAILEFRCELNGVPYSTANITTIKRHWTGHGNADKAAMIARCRELGYEPQDDNAADAIALCDWAMQ